MFYWGFYRTKLFADRFPIATKSKGLVSMQKLAANSSPKKGVEAIRHSQQVQADYTLDSYREEGHKVHEKLKKKKKKQDILQ